MWKQHDELLAATTNECNEAKAVIIQKFPADTDVMVRFGIQQAFEFLNLTGQLISSDTLEATYAAKREEYRSQLVAMLAARLREAEDKMQDARYSGNSQAFSYAEGDVLRLRRELAKLAPRGPAGGIGDSGTGF